MGFEPADSDIGSFETQINFQIWTRDGSRQLAHSPGAPATPLSDSFENGYANVTVNGQPWRMYAATDVDNRIQIQVGIALADRRAEFRAWLWQGLKASALLFLLLTLTLRRSEEHTSELQSLMRISYAVFCLKKKTTQRATSKHK